MEGANGIEQLQVFAI